MLAGLGHVLAVLAGTLLGLPLAFFALMAALERFERWVTADRTAWPQRNASALNPAAADASASVAGMSEPADRPDRATTDAPVRQAMPPSTAISSLRTAANP
jgi:hypothetical protein